MTDAVTDFNLAYDNARRGVQTQVDYWRGVASNLALPDLERSNAITVAATLAQGLLDLATEHYQKLTAAAVLGPPGDELLANAKRILDELARTVGSVLQGDAIVKAAVGALTALAQLQPKPSTAPAAEADPQGVAVASAAVDESADAPLAAALSRTVFAISRHARARLTGER